MKYLILVLMLISNIAYANTQYSTIDKVNWEVNQKFEFIPNNCLIVAKEKQRRLLKVGIKSNIVVIQPNYADMKHAVLCVDDQCLDNGDISYDIFNKNELNFYGMLL